VTEIIFTVSLKGKGSGQNNCLWDRHNYLCTIMHYSGPYGPPYFLVINIWQETEVLPCYAVYLLVIVIIVISLLISNYNNVITTINAVRLLCDVNCESPFKQYVVS